MICKNCSVAADMVTVARDWNPEEWMQVNWTDNTFETVPITATVRALASVFHGTCKGRGHCDCQHIIDWEGKRTKQ